MDRWLVISSMIVAYLGLTLWVGLRAGRGTTSTVEGFVAGDRNFGFLIMYFVTGATVFSAFAGLLAGGTTTLLFFFWPALKPIALHEGVFGLIAHVPVLILVSLITPVQDRALVKAYVHPPAAERSASPRR